MLLVREARQEEADDEGGGKRPGAGALWPVIMWLGHRLVEHRSEDGERGLACRKCGATGAQGHLRAKWKRKELLAQECRGEGRGCKEQLRRQ